LLEKRTGIPTYIAEDAVSCVAKGTGMSLEHIDILEKNMMTPTKKRYL
jgi:rod shape-determining protein MreB